MSKKWRIAPALMIMLLALLISACGSSTGGTTETPTPTPSTAASNVKCETGNLQITGSSALEPLIKEAATLYQAKCNGAQVTVGAGGSSTGLKNVSDGSSDIGNSDVYADPAKYGTDLVDNQVALIVFSVVVNEKVKDVKNLTSAQLKDIYTGKVSNWKELGGPDLAIVPVSRPAGSGTRLTFEATVLGGPEAIPAGQTNPSAKESGEVSNTVSQTDGAISYVQTDFAKKESLNTITIDGVASTDENVFSDKYKFWSSGHMYTKGEPSALAKAFIDFVKGPDLDATRKDQGYLDITKVSQEILDSKKPKE